MDDLARYWEVTDTAIRVAGIFANAYIIGWFYAPYLVKRRLSYYVGGTFLIAMLFIFFVPYEFSGTAAWLFGALLTCLVSFFIDRRNIPQKIFLAATAYLMRWISARLSLLPWMAVMQATFQNPAFLEPPQLPLVLYAIVLFFETVLSNLILFGALFIINRTYLNKREEMSVREMTLLLVPYLPILVGYWLSSYVMDVYLSDTRTDIYDAHPFFNIFLAVFQVVAFFAVLTVLTTYQTIRKAKRRETEQALFEKQLVDLQTHITNVENLYGDLRLMRHDMNHHIMVLDGLYRQRKFDEAERYVTAWKEATAVSDANARTGNPVTDIILSEKKREAEARGISFSGNFAFPENGNVDVLDMSVVLSNVLSNAIAAADCGLSGGDADLPYVSISSHRERNAYLIVVKNSFRGTLLFDEESGLPRTSKDDTERHGFGLRNVKRVAEKYFGTMELKQEGNEVTMTVMLMLA